MPALAEIRDERGRLDGDRAGQRQATALGMAAITATIADKGKRPRPVLTPRRPRLLSRA